MSCSRERQALLISRGWRRQFMAAEPRLGEAVREYQRLGFDVHLEPVDPAACRDEQCAACLQEPAAAAALKVIFTRPRNAGSR